MVEEIVTYDSENDVLYYNKGRKAQDSIKVKDFVVDFDSNNRIVGLEILNASKNVEFFANRDITQEDLQRIIEANLNVRRRGGVAIITFTFLSKGLKEETEIEISLEDNTVPA